MEVTTLEEYFALPDSRFSQHDAEVIGPELQRLYRAGRSSARDVVAEAETETSPLHGYFEWDDPVAAHLYREEQARRMIRSIAVRVISPEGQEEMVRAFLSVRVPATADEQTEREAPSVKQYVPLNVVRQNADMASQVVAGAKESALAWKRRYQQYRQLLGQPFLPIFDAIEDLEEDSE